MDNVSRSAAERKLPLRLYSMVRWESPARMDSLLDRYRMSGYGNGYLTVRAIKRQVDGALGSNGAWLLEPYADLPRSTGLAVEQPDQLAYVSIGDSGAKAVSSICARSESRRWPATRTISCSGRATPIPRFCARRSRA